MPTYSDGPFKAKVGECGGRILDCYIDKNDPDGYYICDKCGATWSDGKEPER